MRTPLFLLALSLTNVAAAAELLPVQGVLFDEFDVPVDAVLPVEFTLYGNAGGTEELWSVVRPVSFVGGAYAVNLGELTSLPADIFANDPTTWLGIAVDGDDEMDLIRIGQVPYAAAATYAEFALDATNAQMLGGATVDDLTYTAGDGVTLSGGEFSLDTAMVESLAQGVCFDTEAELLAALADDFEPLGASPDWSTLSGKPAGFADDVDNDVLGMLGMSCPQGGQAVWDQGTMSWLCAASYGDDDAIAAVIGAGLAEGTLPINGLNEISNQLLTNQFVDTFSDAGIDIPDNAPPGVESVINVPSIGLAEWLNISVQLTNSDTTGLTIDITDPDGVNYLLFDGSNEPSGTELDLTWPTPTATLTGDLTSWAGRDPAGDWTLRVIDSAFLNNGLDGQIASWSVSMQSISSGRIEATGDLEVTGDLTVDGTITGGLRLGNDGSACEEASKGTLRYQPPIGLEACDGTNWVAALPRPVIWHGGCSVDLSNDWRFFCLDRSVYDTATATGYLTVDDTTVGNSTADTTGRVTANIGGYYRVSWMVNGSNHTSKYTHLYLNGDPINYVLTQHDNNRWRVLSGSTIVKLEPDDYLNLRVFGNTGTNVDDDGGYTVGGVTYPRRNWLTIEYLGTDW
jgi:subtilisin-like proprotein convertase family protein